MTTFRSLPLPDQNAEAVRSSDATPGFVFPSVSRTSCQPEKGSTVLAGVCAGSGPVTVRVEETPDPKAIRITFADSGVPFDPTAKADPDVTLPAEERMVGGLGIFLVKKTMDAMEYERRDGMNVLTIRKAI